MLLFNIARLPVASFLSANLAALSLIIFIMDGFRTNPLSEQLHAFLVEIKSSQLFTYAPHDVNAAR